METIEEDHATKPVKVSQAATVCPATAGTGAQVSGEFLIFRLASEEYGVDILQVQEIRSYEAPTGIADAPAFIKGVINLRGVVVPILDLRLKLALECDYTDLTVVIVLNLDRRVVGVVVDAVSDVLALGVAQIRPVPEFDGAGRSRFITGIGAAEGDGHERMLILVDIGQMIGATGLDLTKVGLG